MFSLNKCVLKSIWFFVKLLCVWLNFYCVFLIWNKIMNDSCFKVNLFIVKICIVLIVFFNEYCYMYVVYVYVM